MTEVPAVPLSQARGKKLILIALLWLLALSPGLWMTNHVLNNAVDAGCWDMWEDAPLLKKWHDGALTWGDLYAPQIQHRIVVPRLLIIGLAHLGGGDFRYQQWFCFALAWVSLFLLGILLKRTLGDSRWRYGNLFFAGLLVFSPMHFQTFFWGSAMWMAIPMPCLLGALVVLGCRWPLWVRFVSTLFLAEVATHSFSHGLVLWPVVLGYLLLQPELGTLKRRLVLSGIWALAAGVTLGCYFHDFYNVAFHAYNLMPGDHALKGGVKLFEGENFPRVIRFFLGMFGSICARTPYTNALVADSQALGIWIVAPLALVTVGILSTKAGRSLWRTVLPFLAVAVYVIAVALAISAGRAHLGEHRCVLPRYLTVTVFGPVMTMVLAFFLVRVLASGARCGPACREFAARLGVAALCIACAFQYPIWLHGLHLSSMWRNARLQGRALTLFLNYDSLKPWSLDTLDMDVRRWGFPQTREAANTLKSLGMLKAPLLETPELRWFRKEKTALGKEKSLIEPVRFAGDKVIITGQARFSTTRSADLILITAPDSGNIIALGTPTPPHQLRQFPLDYEFMNSHEVTVGEAHRWEARLPLTAIPAGSTHLDAWILDVQKMSVTRLAQTLDLSTRPPAVPHP
jgi:hypothetical protein